MPSSRRRQRSRVGCVRMPRPSQALRPFRLSSQCDGPKRGRTGIGRGLDALRIGGNLPFIQDRIYRSPKESLQVRWTAADATGDDSAEQRRLSAAPICRLSVISMAARRFSCPCRAQHLPENTRGENEAGLCERTTRRAPMPSIGVLPWKWRSFGKRPILAGYPLSAHNRSG